MARITVSAAPPHALLTFRQDMNLLTFGLDVPKNRYNTYNPYNPYNPYDPNNSYNYYI